MQKLAKFLSVKLVALALLFVTVSATTAKIADASSYYCGYWYRDPIVGSYTCWDWEPGLPPGARYCTGGGPNSNEIAIYTAPGQEGTCVAIPISTYIPDLSQYGWNNPGVSSNLTVKSYKAGNAVTEVDFFYNTYYNNINARGFGGWAYDTSGSVSSMDAY